MFEQFETSNDEVPVYRQLADYVARLIAVGTLKVGDRVPTQREIARMAGVNVTTVTRAFATLQSQGLVASRPGRGSIITRPRPAPVFRSAPEERMGFADLSVNRPATPGYLGALSTVMTALPDDPRYVGLQDFHAPEGPEWARAALAGWLATAVGEDDPTRVIVTNGAQHGLSCTLGAIAQPGDTILADAITYQGVGALCRWLGLGLKPVSMDAGGMLPEAFEQACAREAPRAVFLVPNLQNPTAITLDAGRRQAIAATARRHGVTIIEDDVYRPLADDPPPAFAATDPDITFHISGFSKCVAPGLRLGAVVAPRDRVGDVAAILRINCWSTGPLAGLVATRMIEDGLIAKVIAENAAELRLRQAIVAEVLGEFGVTAHGAATHAWLALPEPWRGGAFARAAHGVGVGVLPGEAFAVARDDVPHAVRINAGAARSQPELRAALASLRALLTEGYRRVDAVV